MTWPEASVKVAEYVFGCVAFLTFAFIAWAFAWGMKK